MKEKIKVLLTIFFLIILVSISYIYTFAYNDFNLNGDSYMTVLFSKIVEEREELNYGAYNEVGSAWGKEGNIYFTPGLHIFNYLLKNISGIEYTASIYLLLFIFSLIFFSIFYIFLKGKTILPFILFCFIYVFSFLRDKRYFITPGYHFQNMFGDFLMLFILIYVYKLLKNLKT